MLEAMQFNRLTIAMSVEEVAIESVTAGGKQCGLPQEEAQSESMAN